jgi:hypothetical protein
MKYFEEFESETHYSLDHLDHMAIRQHVGATVLKTAGECNGRCLA